MRITPTHPLTMNGLRGFGFTVTWGDQSTAVRKDVRQTIRPDTPAGGDPGARQVVKSSGAVFAAGAGRSAAGTQAPPVDTPKAQNDDFRRIKVLGSINE